MAVRGFALTPFRFILLALDSYRLTRVITADSWPLSEWFRNSIAVRFGESSAWYTLFTCEWCFGVWVTASVFTFDHFIPIPIVILAAVAAMTIVGFLGSYAERP